MAVAPLVYIRVRPCRYPGGPGLAVVHSDADMKRARKACKSICVLGVRWHKNEWKWVDGQTLGWNGKAGGYQRWGGEDINKKTKEQRALTLTRSISLNPKP